MIASGSSSIEQTSSFTSLFGVGGAEGVNSLCLSEDVDDAVRSVRSPRNAVLVLAFKRTNTLAAYSEDRGDTLSVDEASVQ